MSDLPDKDDLSRGAGKVLILDGPAAGQTLERPIFSSTLVYREALRPEFIWAPTGRTPPSPLSLMDYTDHFYTVSRFAFQGGYIIYVASINPNGPSMEDFIEYVLTDEAKEALGA